MSYSLSGFRTKSASINKLIIAAITKTFQRGCSVSEARLQPSLSSQTQRLTQRGCLLKALAEQALLQSRQRGLMQEAIELVVWEEVRSKVFEEFGWTSEEVVVATEG